LRRNGRVKVAFQIIAAGAMIFGIGGGATRVRGQLYNPPSAVPFTGYPVMGDRNKDFPIAPINMVVNFPAAGSYPYEIGLRALLRSGFADPLIRGMAVRSLKMLGASLES
jgi:hypothetical protein